MNAHSDPTSIAASVLGPDGEIAPARTRTPPVSQPGIVAGVLAFDTAAILLAGVLTSRLWPPELGKTGWIVGASLLVVTTIALAGMGRSWVYTIPALRSFFRQAAQTGLWLFIGVSGMIVTAYLLGWPLENMRYWTAFWFAGAWGTIVANRLALRFSLNAKARSGALVRRTVIAGGGVAAATLIERLEQSGNRDIDILGLFDDRDGMRSPAALGGYRKMGTFDQLEAFCREQDVDLIVIALPPTAEERILQLLKKLWALPVDIRISAHGSKLKLRERAYARIGDVPLLPVFDKPMSDWGHAVKTIEDRVVAALALIALSPLLALTALAVRLDSRGPIFFRQIRYGFNNEPIHIFKFRSMYVDQCDSRANKLVTKGDPRVTRVGRFIRKTSIDELPQLFNVLMGDLSLVGPRPHAMQAKAAGRVYDEVVDGYFARHRMKPGITGWAQVNGWRGETDTIEKIEQRVRHDLYYIDNWSLGLDFYILLKTPLSLFDTRNAY